eukprot:TRINITY_DN12737_c1_g1_i1.p1 TRINITY_DN12737_c1_g1~~TRINITY_DN12737_c1_g1_i1.p1  ORF type:complete len:1556 (-),score=408.83 TRINITY_DN12737_c1_g1_i1:30-4622(-)
MDEDLAAAIAMSLEKPKVTVKISPAVDTLESLIQKVREASQFLPAEASLEVENKVTGASATDELALLSSIGVVAGHGLKLREALAPKKPQLKRSTSMKLLDESTRQALERSAIELQEEGCPPGGSLSRTASATSKSPKTADSQLQEPAFTKLSETRFRYRRNTSYAKWNIRESPSMDAKAVYAVDHDAEFELLQKQDDWMRVTHKSPDQGLVEGWVLSCVDGEAFIIPVALEYMTPDGEALSLEDAPFLSTCIRLFKEPLDLALLPTVPVSTPYSQTLEAAMRQEELKPFLVDQDAMGTAQKIIDEVRRGENSAAKDTSGDDEKNLDSEVVQEQEQEQEQQKEQSQQKQQRTDYARNPKGVDAWHLSWLTEPERLIGSSFHRAAEFKITGSSKALAYPSSLLLTQDYAPQMHRFDQARRLKNVEVIMRWEATADQKMRCVVLSLAEAESLRRFAQRDGAARKIKGMSIDLCSVRGLWISENPPVEEVAKLDAVQVEFSDGGSSDLSFNTLRQTARFFNGEMWLEEQEIIAILQSLAEAAASERQEAFEETMTCRRRDMVAWQGTALQKVFDHSDHQHLLKMLRLSLHVRRALEQSGTPLSDIFAAWDSDRDTYLSCEELAKGVTALAGLQAEEVAELWKHADLNSDGYLSYREFASEFGRRSDDMSSGRVERLLQRHRSSQRGAQSSKGHGLLGLQEGMMEARAAAEGDFGEEVEEISAMDWQKLASVGKRFLTSGAHINFQGDGRVDMLSGNQASFSPRGVNLTTGKWYFEVVIFSSGPASVGWALVGEKGGPVGDGPGSWGLDGFAKVLRHDGKTEACKKAWQTGDVLGCCADLDKRKLSYVWNGEHVEDEVAGFDLESLCESGLVPAISFDSTFKFRVNFGDTPFRYVPSGFRSVHHWICEFMEMQHVKASGARLGKIMPTSGASCWKLKEEEEGVTHMQAVEVPGEAHNFPSAILGGCLLTSGKWYYEFTIMSQPGFTVWQNGWADLDFVGSQRDGFGVGDDKHSWAFDGVRAFAEGAWFNGSHGFGLETKIGDVVGCEADLDKKRLSFSVNGSWAKPMGSCLILENIEYVAGLTPALTLGRNVAVDCNIGGRPFKYNPRPGSKPVIAWVNDRRSRYIDAMSADERVEALAKQVQEGQWEDTKQSLHQRRVLEAELEEAKLRTDSYAGEGREIKAPLFRTSSGHAYAVHDEDGEMFCTGCYSSVVAEMSLPPGSWVFEVSILDVDAGATSVSAVIGWVDSKQFWGDFTKDQGVGDDALSWGFAIQGSTSSEKDQASRKLHDGSSEAFGLPVKAGSVVGCAVTLGAGGVVEKILFGIDGKWRAPAGQAFAGGSVPSGTISPAASLRENVRLQFNFGRRPFEHVVPRGFLPASAYLDCMGTADDAKAPSWLKEEKEEQMDLSPEADQSAPAGQGAMPLLLQQLSGTLQLLQIEAARSGTPDETLEGMLKDMTEQANKLAAHVKNSSTGGSDEKLENIEMTADALKEKVASLVTLVSSLGQTITEERAEELIKDCGGSVDNAFAILMPQ